MVPVEPYMNITCRPHATRIHPCFCLKTQTLLMSLLLIHTLPNFDLCDGFYHVPLAPYTQQFFGVKCVNQFYRFTRHPMGWTLSPSLMQCDITREFKHLTRIICQFLIYYDDLLMYGIF